VISFDVGSSQTPPKIYYYFVWPLTSGGVTFSKENKKKQVRMTG